MRILVTGAAGAVAGGAVRTLAGHFELRLLDVKRAKGSAHQDWVIGSILDQEVRRKALEGVGAVVHFAIVRPSSDDEQDTDRTFDVNVKGLYLLLETCDQLGIRRFVHVSSTAPVIGHWYAGRDVSVTSPPTTVGRYSLTKWLQEQICEHMARNSEMTIIALRPWAPCDGLTTVSETGDQIPRPYQPGLIDSEDFGHACRLAIQADHLRGFQLFHTVATQEARRRFDAARTEQMLGFRAREDFSSLLQKQG
jgi:nucleoside-diphosphate-sugar epimerase